MKVFCWGPTGSLNRVKLLFYLNEFWTWLKPKSDWKLPRARSKVMRGAEAVYTGARRPSTCWTRNAAAAWADLPVGRCGQRWRRFTHNTAAIPRHMTSPRLPAFCCFRLKYCAAAFYSHFGADFCHFFPCTFTKATRETTLSAFIYFRINFSINKFQYKSKTNH